MYQDGGPGDYGVLLGYAIGESESQLKADQGITHGGTRFHEISLDVYFKRKKEAETELRLFTLDFSKVPSEQFSNLLFDDYKLQDILFQKHKVQTFTLQQCDKQQTPYPDDVFDTGLLFFGPGQKVYSASDRAKKPSTDMLKQLDRIMMAFNLNSHYRYGISKTIDPLLNTYTQYFIWFRKINSVNGLNQASKVLYKGDIDDITPEMAIGTFELPGGEIIIQ